MHISGIRVVVIFVIIMMDTDLILHWSLLTSNIYKRLPYISYKYCMLILLNIAPLIFVKKFICYDRLLETGHNIKIVNFQATSYFENTNSVLQLSDANEWPVYGNNRSPISLFSYVTLCNHRVDIASCGTHKCTPPFYFSQRRDYSALTKFLPPKHEYILSVRLSDLQAKIYKTYLERIGGERLGEYCL